ncbi:hypothetical protein [Halorussus aquaticus]|uniref:DUF7978 domain-containing protein n=1 Tax=Halorussus aquaticus TaxID=2953748 RepID=A0ABD5PYM9_9EURY|nr:hypothetical protein [Halorussus aquaticus]
MRVALQRVLAGAAAYLLAYGLAAALTLYRLPTLLGRHLEPSRRQQYWEYYVAAGEPTEAVVGWFLASAHRVPMMTVTDPGSTGVSAADVFAARAPSLYLAPAIACLVAGFVAARRPWERAPVPVGVGAFLTVGYAAAFVASAFQFRVDTGSELAFPALFNFGSLQWVVVVPLFPLVFGTLGAFVGTSVSVRQLLLSVE